MPDVLLYLQSPSRTWEYIIAQIKSAHNLLCALNDTTVCLPVCCLHVCILFKLSGLRGPYGCGAIRGSVHVLNGAV